MSPWEWSIVGFFTGMIVGVVMLHLAWWRRKLEGFATRPGH